MTAARGTAVATAAERVRIVVRATATGRRQLRAARSVTVIASIANVGDAPIEHKRRVRSARR